MIAEVSRSMLSIRLLAKVLFLIPQPCPSPNGEGLKRLSQEVYLKTRFLEIIFQEPLLSKLFQSMQNITVSLPVFCSDLIAFLGFGDDQSMGRAFCYCFHFQIYSAIAYI